MTEKRFELSKSDIKDFRIYDDGKEDAYFIDCDEHTGICLVSLLNQLNDDNEQLKQSSTMYYQLFVELQKQMKGVKKASDLDSKDFEDLIELSKGNVFDDEIGWIHLPVKELEE